MSLYHVYPIGAQLIVIDSHSIFRVAKPEDMQIHLLTITEERVVKGDYSGKAEHYGYKATDEDGDEYNCQWEYFDETSSQPYQNWIRRSGKKSLELCWEITHSYPFIGVNAQHIWSEFLGRVPFLQGMLEHINNVFPSRKIVWCRKMQKKENGKDNTNAALVHDTWFYENEECFYCKHDL